MEILYNIKSFITHICILNTFNKEDICLNLKCQRWLSSSSPQPYHKHKVRIILNIIVCKDGVFLEHVRFNAFNRRHLNKTYKLYREFFSLCILDFKAFYRVAWIHREDLDLGYARVFYGYFYWHLLWWELCALSVFQLENY